MTFRLPGFEQKRPYPGLASFTEEDAEYFFGREAEVEAVWAKLKRPRLLALIGPSGTGKSSFIRAGLLATLPSSWAAIVATPGHRPQQSLAQALVPAFSGDAQAMQEFLRFEEPDTAVGLVSRWRQKHEHALLVVDQFEELFTLNPPETQAAFADLLGRLVLEADVNVLLSLRDDFLFHCNSQKALTPAFADLTPLGTLGDSALRRALVQPALSCGYRFEDEALVEEMVEEVGRERGALPLLAFAASRLWEKRDRDRGLLTREAYQEIGGVGGALAQHAEATLEGIGTHRTPLVRELFRNLVTAQGTRAVRERDELLSVFEKADAPQARAEAEEALAALVDARLLTSFERSGDDTGESRHEIEIIHESLLSRWPRLVRWQTQDADGAQLRDQLQQAAKLWEEKGRPEELLWTGRAYDEYRVWRGSYTGGLTAIEDAFAQAATRRVGRQRRLRRLAVAALLSAAAAVAIVTSVLWQKSETARRRAEASQLLTQAGVELERYPTGALAYVTRSLELADTETGRLLALRILQRAPVARIAPAVGDQSEGGFPRTLDFSPNGEWLAAGGYQKTDLLHRDGDWRLALGGFRSKGQSAINVKFGPTGKVLVANHRGEIRVWSIPDGRELRHEEVDSGPSGLELWTDGFLTLTGVGDREIVRWWPFGAGESRLIGSMEPIGPASVAGSVLAYGRDSTFYLRSLEDWGLPPRLLAESEAEGRGIALSPDGTRVATSDASHQIRIRPTDVGMSHRERVISAPASHGLHFDPTGRWLTARETVEGDSVYSLIDPEGPGGAEPMKLQRVDVYTNGTAFDAEGRWFATAHATDVALWWLEHPGPRILKGHEGIVTDVVFTPDGQRLLSASPDGTVRSWPLSASAGDGSRVVFRAPLKTPGLAIDPSGRQLLVSGARGHVHLVPLNGEPARELPGFSEETAIWAVAFGGGGRLAAAAPYIAPREEKVIRVWDLETGSVQVLGPVPGAGDGFIGGVDFSFVGSDRIVAGLLPSGVVSYDLRSGVDTLLASKHSASRLSHDRTFGIGFSLDEKGDVESQQNAELVRFDVGGGPPTALSGYPPGVARALAINPSDTLVAVSPLWPGGVISIGPVDGGEPHLLIGHKGPVNTVAFSPDGRWLASGGADGTIRIWPVPDASRTPFHRRPLADVMRILRSHTNLRAVVDPDSATGYKLEPGPFPGWANPPEAW